LSLDEGNAASCRGFAALCGTFLAKLTLIERCLSRITEVRGCRRVTNP